MKELPVINVLPVHELYLPVQKKTFSFVPYTVEQERNILTAIDSKDTRAIVSNYMKVISECGDGIDFENLTAMEFILIAVNLRSKSKGEILDISTKCKKCEKPIELSINIEDHIITENEEIVTDICKIDDELAFEIVPVKMSFLYEVEGIETQADLLLETAAHSIKKVFWNKEIYTDFTPDQIMERITLTYPTLKKIFESSSKLIKMTLKIDVACHDKECGHTEDYIVRDFLKYLS